MENNDKRILQVTNKIVLFRIAINAISRQLNFKNDKLNLKRHHLMSLINKIETENDIIKLKKEIEKIINFIEKNIKEDGRLDKNLIIKKLSSSAHLNKLDYDEKQKTIDNVSRNITVTSAIISLKNCLNRYCEAMGERETLLRKIQQESTTKEDNKTINSSSTNKSSVKKSHETITLNIIVKMAKDVKKATVNFLLSIKNNPKLLEYENEKGFEKYSNARKEFIKQFNKMNSNEQKYYNEYFVQNYQSYAKEFNLGNISSVDQIATVSQIKNVINKAVAKEIENSIITKDSYTWLNRATQFMNREEIINIYKKLKDKYYFSNNEKIEMLQQIFAGLIANKYANDDFNKEFLYNIQLFLFEIKNMGYFNLESISNIRLKLQEYQNFILSDQISIEFETRQGLVEDINVVLDNINRFINQPNLDIEEEKDTKRI